MITVGVPKGLLYYKYHVFAETLLKNIGAEFIVSPDTNKAILDMGVSCCVDDACLPVKVFHGHVCWLKERCDCLLMPRFISVVRKKYVCPMFCGLNDMLRYSISQLPRMIGRPIFSVDEASIFLWAKDVAQYFTKDKKTISSAYKSALKEQKDSNMKRNKTDYPFSVALIGHPYIIYDRFLSMNVVEKLNRLDIGVVTEDSVDDMAAVSHVAGLFKQPFWYFASRYYGAAIELCQRKTDGIIYISAFSCGVDSVVVELIKNDVRDVPVMILKIDEHTGEAGFDTRVEAFADMLKRRAAHERDDTAFRQHVYCCKSTV